MHAFLGNFRGTLLSDGYDGYAAYAAQRPGEVTHALCWSHTRRTFERAKDSEPEAVAEALALVGAMYAHEKQIRADALTGQDKRAFTPESVINFTGMRSFPAQSRLRQCLWIYGGSDLTKSMV